MVISGLEILLTNLAKEECPSYRALRDLNRKSKKDQSCIYGDGEHQDKCMECWKKAVGENYPLLEREV